MTSARFVPLASLVALLLVHALPRPAAPQDATGDARLRGLVFDSTSMGPLAGAMVAVLGTSARGSTDEDGRFLLEGVPAGSYSVSFFHRRLQTLGVSAPVEPVAFAAGGTVAVTLSVPSRETLLEAWCLSEATGPDVARLAGTVRDTLTGVPIPRATVTLLPLGPVTGERRNSQVERRTDDAGYFRFCDAPVGRARVQAHFGLSSGPSQTLALLRERPVIRDLGMVLSSVGRLRGRVADYVTGQPLAGATVSLAGSDLVRSTDSSGRFLLDSIPPGRHVLRTEFLGYASALDSVTVFSSEAVAVDVRLATEPIPVHGLVVTSRARIGEPLVDVGRRLDYLGRVEIDRLLPRVRDMGDLLDAAAFPALDVREINHTDAVGGVVRGLCIEAVRMRRGNGCHMVMVVLDGVPLQNPVDRLTSLPPDIVESVRYLGPMEGTTRFGSSGASGVLVITTRVR